MTKDLKKLLNKYPPPRTGEEFQKRWTILLPKVVHRENFSEAHLSTLEVLCDLYAEYYNLRASLDVTGYSYRNIESRYGETVKNYPEVGQLNICRNQISAYSKMLGLILAKDKTEADTGKSGDEWS